MRCKSCNNGLTEEEEKIEQCPSCYLDELTDPALKEILMVVGLVLNKYSFNGRTTRHLMSRVNDEVCGS